MNILFTSDLIKELRNIIPLESYTPKTEQHVELMKFCLDEAEKIHYNSVFNFINKRRKKRFNAFINRFSGLYCRNDADYENLKDIVKKHQMVNI